MGNEPILTSEGKKALEEKLEHLQTTVRRQVSEQMKKAVEHGDLSENAEYDEARNALNKLERDIYETSTLLARATVVDDDSVSTDTVGVGSLVRVEEISDGGKELEYRLVGPTESDPGNGKISHMCPIGKALMDTCVDDTVSVETPSGTKEYRVISITR